MNQVKETKKYAVRTIVFESDYYTWKEMDFRFLEVILQPLYVKLYSWSSENNYKNIHTYIKNCFEIVSNRDVINRVYTEMMMMNMNVV